MHEHSDALRRVYDHAPPWAPTSVVPWLAARCDASMVDTADLRRCSIESRLQLAQCSTSSTLGREDSEIPLTLEKFMEAEESCGGTKAFMCARGQELLKAVGSNQSFRSAMLPDSFLPRTIPEQVEYEHACGLFCIHDTQIGNVRERFCKYMSTTVADRVRATKQVIDQSLGEMMFHFETTTVDGAKSGRFQPIETYMRI